ncbi:hypothetical protein AYI87_03445 [Shewanella sp. KCT]|nr:hypothetical protein AYI87_03445 [Shewanella sp. KCT]
MAAIEHLFVDGQHPLHMQINTLLSQIKRLALLPSAPHHQLNDRLGKEGQMVANLHIQEP